MGESKTKRIKKESPIRQEVDPAEEEQCALYGNHNIRMEYVTCYCGAYVLVDGLERAAERLKNK